jgi:hypothetical protein
MLGVSVLSFAVIGLVLALLLAVFVPPRPPRTRGEALRQDDARREARRAANLFAWLLVAVLVVAIVVRYV